REGERERTEKEREANRRRKEGTREDVKGHRPTCTGDGDGSGRSRRLLVTEVTTMVALGEDDGGRGGHGGGSMVLRWWWKKKTAAAVLFRNGWEYYDGVQGVSMKRCRLVQHRSAKVKPGQQTSQPNYILKATYGTIRRIRRTLDIETRTKGTTSRTENELRTIWISRHMI
ncbi:hypothetical protein M8C21_001478, partial [Ambrosia artemisiifolia]